MRNTILATGAALLALAATSIAPASAGGYGHHGYYYSHGYDHSDVYQRPPPVGVLYKHYLPDEDDFGYLPRRHYAPRYVSRHYYRERTHRHDSRDYYSRDSDCDWLYRRAKRSDSRYWWNRYEKCED